MTKSELQEIRALIVTHGDEWRDVDRCISDNGITHVLFMGDPKDAPPKNTFRDIIFISLRQTVSQYSPYELKASVLAQNTAHAIGKHYILLSKSTLFEQSIRACEVHIFDYIFGSSISYFGLIAFFGSHPQATFFSSTNNKIYDHLESAINTELNIDAFRIHGPKFVPSPPRSSRPDPRDKASRTQSRRTDRALRVLEGLSLLFCKFPPFKPKNRPIFIITRNNDTNYSDIIRSFKDFSHPCLSFLFLSSRTFSKINAKKMTKSKLHQIFNASFDRACSFFLKIFLHRFFYNHLNKFKNESNYMFLFYLSFPSLSIFFSKHIYSHVSSHFRVNQIIKESSPRAVIVSPGRDSISRAACLIAAAQNIPTYDLQTVFVGPGARYIKTLAQYQLAIDPLSRAIFIDHFGMSENAVILVGSLKLAQTRSRILEARSTLPLPAQPSAFRITLVLSSDLGSCLNLLTALVNFIARDSRFQLAIRVHPKMPESSNSTINKIISGNNSVFVDTKYNLETRLAHSDVVVTRFSNVGVEAAISDINVITCNFEKNSLPVDIYRLGLSEFADSENRLHLILYDFLESGHLLRDLKIRRNKYINNNNISTHQICRYISNLIIDKI